jgi:hypothetical protein
MLNKAERAIINKESTDTGNIGIKRDRHDITEISLKVALNDIPVTFTFRLHIFAYNTENIKIKWHLSLSSTNRENLLNKNVDIKFNA